MRLKDDQKEAAIREQAIGMIVQEGFQGLSMQKLARAVNISASTIYIYFENKEDLLNKLYQEVDELFTLATLKHFDPEMSFGEGLWLQWKNRLQHILQHPLHFYFSEQFRNSPLIRHDDHQENLFRNAMQRFMKNAVRKGELADLPVEVFWALAYGPFYSLVKFHLDNANMAGGKFSLTEAKMKQAFARVLIALKS